MTGESCDLGCFLKDQKVCFCFLGADFGCCLLILKRKSRRSLVPLLLAVGFLEPHFSYPLLTANFQGLAFEFFGVKRSCSVRQWAEPETVQRTLLLVGSSSKDERWMSGAEWLGAYGWAFASLCALIEPLPPWVPMFRPLSTWVAMAGPLPIWAWFDQLAAYH